MNSKIQCICMCLALILTTPTRAGTWQAGLLAENSQAPFIDNKKETNHLPMVNYIGERFSFIAGKLSYALNTGGAYLTAQTRQQQFYTSSLDLNDEPDFQGMQERDSAFELGAGYEHEETWGKIILEGLIDVTHTHQGYELNAKYSYPQQVGRWLIEPSIGLQLQSHNLVDYYHGVRISEALADRTAYRGEQAINSLFNIMTGYSINAQFLLIAGLEQLTLDTGITDSPIVSEDKVRKIYVGLIYTF